MENTTLFEALPTNIKWVVFIGIILFLAIGKLIGKPYYKSPYVRKGENKSRPKRKKKQYLKKV